MSNDSITDETFEWAAKGAGMTVEEAKRNTFELLKAELAADAHGGAQPNESKSA